MSILADFRRWWQDRAWLRRQREFQRTGTRYYGNGGTIHSSGHLDVETYHGTVVAVWFRCQPLRFQQTEVNQSRAIDMEAMCWDLDTGNPHAQSKLPELCSVEVKDL